MTSAFIQIQDALVQAVANAVSHFGVQVWANRLRPVAAGKNAIVVRIEQSHAQDVVTCGKDWHTVYIIECYARATTAGQDPVREADQLVERIGPTLNGLDLQCLGVINAQVNSGIRWQFDDADTGLACALFGFEVMHRTPAHSLEPWGSPPSPGA